MASTMLIEVRYFGTPKVRVGGSARYLKAPIDENGQPGFNMVGLRKKIRRTYYLPPGADITLVYVDEDRDVVTLVDDDDLREALRQRLKSFRIDVLMNDENVYVKSSSRKSTQVIKDCVGSNEASSSCSAVHIRDDGSCYSFYKCPLIAAYLVNPTVAVCTRRKDDNLCCTCVTSRATNVPAYIQTDISVYCQRP